MKETLLNVVAIASLVVGAAVIAAWFFMKD